MLVNNSCLPAQHLTSPSPLENVLKATEEATGSPIPKGFATIFEKLLSHTTLKDYRISKEKDLKDHHLLVLEKEVTGSFYHIGQLNFKTRFAWKISKGTFSSGKILPCHVFTLHPDSTDGSVGFWPLIKHLKLTRLEFDEHEMCTVLQFKNGHERKIRNSYETWNSWYQSLTVT